MRVLVTGADGFVGVWLVRELLAHGHQVIGGIRLGLAPPARLTPAERLRVEWMGFDLLSPEAVSALIERPLDAVIHLAAVASGADARQDPGYAWTVNAAGTARLCEMLANRARDQGTQPVVLVASTGEVYGQGAGRPLREDDPLVPCSPYAASKLGAEIAALEVGRRSGLRVVVARAFPHTGPGQSDKYVVPALAARLATAKRIGAPVIKTGNLEPVRDFLDVRDVVVAYRLLLTSGRAGVTYNVASGEGRRLRDVAQRLADLMGVRVVLEADPELARPNDLRHLVGDASRLRGDTGWTPGYSFDRTLRDLLDAQAE
jgi:GDP-4-dehydro-6-deoxy-D-mannose reductase